MAEQIEARQPPLWTNGARRAFPSGAVRAQAGPAERTGAAVSLALLLVLNIGFISLNIASFPVRGLVAVGLLGVLCLTYPERLARAVQQHALILWLAFAFTLLGVFVSVLNGTPAPIIFRAVAEIPLQIVITFLTASVLAGIAGGRTSVLVFVGVIAFSALVALLQFVGLDAAWTFRQWLGPLPKDGDVDYAVLRNRRPMGISYSPIQLSTQVCLAFAAFAAMREWKPVSPRTRTRVPADWVILLALFLMFGASFTTGTRSPILGGMVFLAIYAVRRRASWLLLLGALGAAAVYLVWPWLMEVFQAAQPRVVRTDDNSATSRQSLIYFGWLLISDNPLGYGYDFTPSAHWTKFWHDLYQHTNPLAVRVADLHNYPMNMINTYGVGLLLVVPLVFQLVMRGRHAVIFFVPYLVHIMFHNSGPFWNDIPFWFAIAALSVSTGRGESRHRPGARRAVA